MIEDTDPFENSYERIESLQMHVDDLKAKVKRLREALEKCSKELLIRAFEKGDELVPVECVFAKQVLKETK